MPKYIRFSEKLKFSKIIIMKHFIFYFIICISSIIRILYLCKFWIFWIYIFYIYYIYTYRGTVVLSYCRSVVLWSATHKMSGLLPNERARDCRQLSHPWDGEGGGGGNGHILAGTIKDVVTRHAYQRGYHVPSLSTGYSVWSHRSDPNRLPNRLSQVRAPPRICSICIFVFDVFENIFGYFCFLDS